MAPRAESAARSHIPKLARYTALAASREPVRLQVRPGRRTTRAIEAGPRSGWIALLHVSVRSKGHSQGSFCYVSTKITGREVTMEHFLESWGYLAVFTLSLISAIGIPVGAELAIIYGGVLASGHVPNEPHHLNLIFVIALATLAEVLGSFAGYFIGYYGGRSLLDKFGKYVLITHKDLDRADALFARHGEPLALFGRFIPLLRSFVSFVAGLGEMALGKFVAFTTIGCAVWCTALASLGFSLGSSYNHVLKAFNDTGYLLAFLAVITIAGLFFHRLRSVRREQHVT